MVAATTVAALAVIGVLSAVTIQRTYDSNLAADRSKLAATAQVTAELISQQMTSVEDIERVRERLAAKGWPLDDPRGNNNQDHA